MKRLVIIAMVIFTGSVTVGTHAATQPATGKTEDMKTQTDHLKKATFAGGCFWCSEADFEKAQGVAEVISGYTGGQSENPTYEEVSAGRSGHLEAVQVLYDPTQISYQKLLDVFSGGTWTRRTPAGSSPTAGLSTGPRSSTTTRTSGAWRRSPRSSSTPSAASKNRSQPR